jgi:hypothetical protein
VTDIACAALSGLKMGDKILTVRRATARFVFSNQMSLKFIGIDNNFNSLFLFPAFVCVCWGFIFL